MRKIYKLKYLAPVFILFSFFIMTFSVRTVFAVSKTILLKVPFTSQAPEANWKDERQQDGCEEAAALMAMSWVRLGSQQTKAEIILSKRQWRDKIVGLSDWELKKYGEYRDLSLTAIRDWIFKDYFSYKLVAIKKVNSPADIIKELEKGNIILLPMNGRALKNPNFTSPGPERHMILIKGYDYSTKKFITNDPGTRRGENYRYSAETIFKAIRTYKTGYKLPFGKLTKEMLVVSR
ncbi:MAG: C39 family peptidase [Patescibacteria group bacterium]|jgi:hypothetical protein